MFFWKQRLTLVNIISWLLLRFDWAVQGWRESSQTFSEESRGLSLTQDCLKWFLRVRYRRLQRQGVDFTVTFLYVVVFFFYSDYLDREFLWPFYIGSVDGSLSELHIVFNLAHVVLLKLKSLVGLRLLHKRRSTVFTHIWYLYRIFHHQQSI